MSPLLPVRRPHRTTRPLALAAICLGLLGAAVGQETNRLAFTVIRTNGAADPEQILIETNAAADDVVVFHQEPGTPNVATNGEPIVVRLPEESPAPPPISSDEAASREDGIAAGETGANQGAQGQHQPVVNPESPSTSPAVGSNSSPVVAQERQSAEGARDRKEYRKSRSRDQNRTNTTAVVERKGNDMAGKKVEDFAAFRIVADRNIFNPNRRYYRPGQSRPKPRQVDSFSLVGVMSYEKGTFAFFDGSASDFKKVLKASDKIANYTISEITPNAVKLENGGKQLELKVGAQLRREDEGEWTLSNETPTYAASSTASSNANSSAVPDTGNAGDADVLKRLMQRREQE